MVKIGKGDKGMKGTMDKNKNVGELRHERKDSTFIFHLLFIICICWIKSICDLV
jgi:t-SNARE complex subunit (syntaxin)